MRTFLFFGWRPFWLRIQFPPVRRREEDTPRIPSFDVSIGVDVYEDHGPCWRLMLGNLEIRWWLGSWQHKATRERWGT